VLAPEPSGRSFAATNLKSPQLSPWHHHSRCEQCEQCEQWSATAQPCGYARRSAVGARLLEGLRLVDSPATSSARTGVPRPRNRVPPGRKVAAKPTRRRRVSERLLNARLFAFHASTIHKAVHLSRVAHAQISSLELLFPDVTRCACACQTWLDPAAQTHACRPACSASVWEPPFPFHSA
jgi:hypothetical protein